MAYVLLIQRSDKPEMKMEIPVAKRIVIGASPYCDVHLDDKMIAKMQCEIEPAKTGHIVATNIDKKRDVFLNEGKLKRAGIKKDDVLKIGIYTVRIDSSKLTPDELAIINTEYEELV